jgi:hypothetical protein
MKSIGRLEQATVLLGIVGSATAMLASSLTFGLAAGWHVAYKENKFFPIGWNPLEDLALRYILIAALFLLFIAFFRMRGGLLLKGLALIPLVLILHQSRILTLSLPSGLPSWVTEYSRPLEVILYVGVFVLALGVLVTILNIYSIWLTYHTSRYDAS